MSRNWKECDIIGDKLTIGSLFSGIGGIELGLERTGGFETRWQCEINDYARRVLAKNWPGLPIYNDVKDLYETEWPEKVDVLCGGFPCQPFSTAGKRQGESDERHLWPEFIRIVRQVRPRWIIAENVPGLLTIDAGRPFGRILWSLAECGYYIEWDTISAASVGALHPRNRIFIIGRMGDPQCFPQGHGNGDDVPILRNSKESREARSSIRPGEGPYVPNSSIEGVGGLPIQQGRSRQTVPYIVRSGEDVSNPKERGDVRRNRQLSNVGIFERGRGDNRLRMFRDAVGQWWAVEPDVGRVANGVPSRVDRLGRLGNAVVPQVAQYIGECILEFEGIINSGKE